MQPLQSRRSRTLKELLHDKNWVRGCVLTIVALVCGISAIIFTYLATSNFLELSGGYINMRTQWETNLVQEIIACDQGIPEGFERAWLGNYPGTYMGCDCISSHPEPDDGVDRKIYSGSCSYNQSRAGCWDVYPTYAQNLTLFGDMSSFCIKRLPDSSFKDIFFNMESDGTCKSGHIRCGGNDNNIQAICLNNTDKCPVGDVIINQSNPDPNKYTESITSGSATVYLSRGNWFSPLVDLRNEEFQMCIDSTTLAITPGHTSYPLMKIKKSSCLKDDRYTRLDYTGERTLFRLNHVDYKSLTHFETSDEFLYYRFKRGLIPWGQSCRGEFSEFFARQKKITFLRLLEQAILILTIIHSIITFGISIIRWAMLPSRSLSPSSPLLVSSPLRRSLLLRVLPSLCSLLSSVLLSVPLLLSLVLSSRFADYFLLTSEKVCSDPFTTSFLQQLAHSIQVNVFKFNLAAVIAVAIGAVAEAEKAVWEAREEMKVRNAEIETEGEEI